MRLSTIAFLLVLLPACGGGTDQLALKDEYAFRMLRENFHVANIAGDRELLRSLFADDAALTAMDGTTYLGADAITDYLAGKPGFGKRLILTLESSWNADRGAEFGFESVAVDVGGNDPTGTDLSVLGAQNPDVEIVEHDHTTGRAVRMEDAHWVFQELTVAEGPLPSELATQSLASAGSDASLSDPSIAGEVGFRRMRETFHRAGLIGSVELLRTVWAKDSVFSTGTGTVVEGRDAIVEFMSSAPTFGNTLTLTPESSSRLRVNGDVAEFGFECIWIAVVGAEHPETTSLCASDGTQNPAVEIFRHSHATGIAVRLPDGRWVLKEFHGGGGPLPPAIE